MKFQLRSLLACCAAGTLAVSLAACGPEDVQETATTQMGLAETVEPGWSMMDLAGVDPEFYRDSAGDLPQALPMKAAFSGNLGEAPGYGYAPAFDYAPDHEDRNYEPLPDNYYYDSGYYDDAPHDSRYDSADGTGDYALLALAAALAGMLGDAPPDYGFAYDGVSPWAWQTSDRYYRYAEPIQGGYRYYYYEPDSYRPFLVSDPYYSYGYRGSRLAVIYDSAGRRVDARRAERQLQAAKSYYARAERLHRAAQHERFGVSAPLWDRHRERISRDRDSWRNVRAERPEWQRWEASNSPALYRQWSNEALVRRAAERNFDNWQKAEYRTPAPAFYTRETRQQQVRNLAELRRDRAAELAERRQALAEQQRQHEARLAAQRTENARQAAERQRQHEARLAAQRTENARQAAERQREQASKIAERRGTAAERIAQQREAREQRQQPSLQRVAAITPASNRATEQRREQQRVVASAAAERTRSNQAAQTVRRQQEERAQAQRQASERREELQRQQQARQEARQSQQQAKREQTQANAALQRAQAAQAERKAERERAQREAETRRAEQAEARQAQQAQARQQVEARQAAAQVQREARQAQQQQQARQQAEARQAAAQAQAKAQREARQAQQQARQQQTGAAQQDNARAQAQARQQARQLAAQERQDARTQRREERQNGN